MRSCVNQLLDLAVAKNIFGCVNFLGLFLHLFSSTRGSFINWSTVSLKVRKNKTTSPFQSGKSSFLKRPSVYQLHSIFHGLSKTEDYRQIASEEQHKIKLLLSEIPDIYHPTLFPWNTATNLEIFEKNCGISEFTWVVAQPGRRLELTKFLNNNFIIHDLHKSYKM